MINYSLNHQTVATGSSYSAVADDEHAKRAVQTAMAKMRPDSTIGSVLLFLSSAYAHAPKGAIKAAAKAAGTPQVFGCCAISLLTEDEWLMDIEGAVAMVFPSDMALQPMSVLQRQNVLVQSALTFSSPNAADIAINSTPVPQIGAISSDEYGHGPFSIWQSGHIVEHEFCLTAFPSTLTAHSAIADGVKRLSPNMQINLADSHSLKIVNEVPVLSTLSESLQTIAKTQPYQLLCAISENNEVSNLEKGQFSLHHVVSVNDDNGAIQLSGSPKAGRYMFWAMRDAAAAEQSMQHALSSLKQTLDTPPLFGLMFPNMGRGPQFFDGQDKDLECFKRMFPETPLLGFYGQGEIVPGSKKTGLIKHYSTVLALYSEN